MADRQELQGSDLATELRAVAGARASDFGLRQCVGWRHRHRQDSPQLGSSRRSSNRFQLRFRLEFLSRFGKRFLRCFEPLEMDSGELSFNAFVKDINEIVMCLVAEKVRETEIRKLEYNFVCVCVCVCVCVFVLIYKKGWVEFRYIVFGLNGVQWVFN